MTYWFVNVEGKWSKPFTYFGRTTEETLYGSIKFNH